MGLSLAVSELILAVLELLFTLLELLSQRLNKLGIANAACGVCSSVHGRYIWLLHLWVSLASWCNYLSVEPHNRAHGTAHSGLWRHTSGAVRLVRNLSHIIRR